MDTISVADAQTGNYELKPISISSKKGTDQDLSVDLSPVLDATVENGAGTTSEIKERSGWRVTAIVAALFLCLFLAALDATIVSTAVPTIASDLNSAAGYTWVGGAYLLANAASGPIWAKLSDIWGRKLIILIDLAAFFATSAACATAQTMQTLIAARALQGIAGGGLILLVQICISDMFSLRQRGLLMGMTEFIWAVAGGIGPILGGVFASLLSWRWCFYINLPFCGVAFGLILLFLDIKHESTSFRQGIKALDWMGIFTFLGCTIMLLLGLDFGGSIFPWHSSKVIALVVVGGLMIFAFIYSESRFARYPLIPLGLFKQKTNVACALVTFFHGCVVMAAQYYMPLYFQSVMEASPLLSGLLLIPLAVITALAGIAAGFIIHHTGRYCELIWTGTFLVAVGTGLFIHFGATTSIAEVVIIQTICGCGLGLLFAPPLIAVQAQVKQDDIATATSTLGFIRDVAYTISIVTGAVIFQNSMDSRSGSLRDAGLADSIVEKLSGKNAEANVMLAASLSGNPSQELAVKQAFAWSIRNMWIFYTILAVCGLVASIFIDKAHLSTEHIETVTGIKTDKDPGVVQRSDHDTEP